MLTASIGLMARITNKKIKTRIARILLITERIGILFRNNSAISIVSYKIISCKYFYTSL